MAFGYRRKTTRPRKGHLKCQCQSLQVTKPARPCFGQVGRAYAIPFNSQVGQLKIKFATSRANRRGC